MRSGRGKRTRAGGWHRRFQAVEQGSILRNKRNVPNERRWRICRCRETDHQKGGPAATSHRGPPAATTASAATTAKYGRKFGFAETKWTEFQQTKPELGSGQCDTVFKDASEPAESAKKPTTAESCTRRSERKIRSTEEGEEEQKVCDFVNRVGLLVLPFFLMLLAAYCFPKTIPPIEVSSWIFVYRLLQKAADVFLS